MPTLIHLSDLHFGSSHRVSLSEIILREIAALNPDAVVISGDLTLRARPQEFCAARAFLDRLARPTLILPGNHDQPLFQPIERFTQPFARYRRILGVETDSTLTAGGWFIAGLNDNRPLVPGGFWSREQRVWLAQQLTHAPRGAVKVVATHHHLRWEGQWRPAGFWYPTRALVCLARHGVELVLNGHTHTPSVGQTREGIVIARAGTAASARTRHGQGNSYNLITLDAQQISVFERGYDARAEAFVVTRAATFERRAQNAIS